MIVDEAFFGFARTGSINGNYVYPFLIDVSKEEQIRVYNGTVEIFGEKAHRAVETKGESQVGQTDSTEWFSENFVIIPDGAQLIQRPRRLMQRIADLREKYGMGKLMYIQGVADPYLIPILVYAGISLFDDSTIRMEASKNIRYTVLGRSTHQQASTEENTEFVREMTEVLARSVKSGTLREVVEKYQISSKAMEILRLLDNDTSGESEQFFPRRTPYIKANSLESLRRPDLERYRKYIVTNYSKPQSRRVAVLMPCSARKPYSNSKSHKRIIEALSGMRNQVHELIVTSPVGLVPRELEQSYPASSYDIPVIGEWYEDEKVMIGDMIETFFRNNTYARAISFVDEDLEFIMERLPKDSILVKWDKSDASLSKLRETVSSELVDSAAPGKINHKMERFSKIAEYQFGSWIVPYLEGSKVVRNYNSEMLVKEGKPVLVYNDRLGKFTINKQSALWFIENEKFLVEIDDFKPTANVYAVGVLGATNDVRQEDEVVLHHGKQLKGVGIAKMPIKAMADLKKGVAVKVRN